MRWHKKKDVSHEQMVDESLSAIEALMGGGLVAGSMPHWVAADLTFSQLKGLMLIRHFHPLTVSELAKHLGMGNPAASILINQLVQQDMVERTEDAKDRRRTILNLTAKGNDLLMERQLQTQTQIRGWLRKMDEPSLASLLRGLTALVQVVHAEQANARRAQQEQMGVVC